MYQYGCEGFRLCQIPEPQGAGVLACANKVITSGMEIYRGQWATVFIGTTQHCRLLSSVTVPQFYNTICESVLLKAVLGVNDN